MLYNLNQETVDILNDLLSRSQISSDVKTDIQKQLACDHVSLDATTAVRVLEDLRDKFSCEDGSATVIESLEIAKAHIVRTQLINELRNSLPVLESLCSLTPWDSESSKMARQTHSDLTVLCNMSETMISLKPLSEVKQLSEAKPTYQPRLNG